MCLLYDNELLNHECNKWKHSMHCSVRGSGFTIHWQGDATAETEERKPSSIMLSSSYLDSSTRTIKGMSFIHKSALFEPGGTSDTWRLAACKMHWQTHAWKEAEQNISPSLCWVTVKMQIQFMHEQNISLNHWFSWYFLSSCMQKCHTAT